MWAKKWACISHPWNHKQQKQNTDESITFFSNQEVMWAKGERSVFKPNNTRKKQKPVGRFSGKSILLQLIMENTHEQLQMGKKFLLPKHTTLCKCKEIHFFAVMIICWGAKLLPSCHHRERRWHNLWFTISKHCVLPIPHYLHTQQTNHWNKQTVHKLCYQFQKLELWLQSVYTHGLQVCFSYGGRRRLETSIHPS